MDGRHRPLGEVAPDCPPALVATVERAMAAAPEDRFATAADMAAALDDVAMPPGDVAATVVAASFADATATVASPPEATEHLAAPPAHGGRSRTGAGRAGAGRRWLGVVVVAVVLLGAALFALSARDRPPADTAPPTTSVTPGGSLPEPLDRAIDQLEASVRP
jgi:serine/threonine-protein kinase